MLNKMRNLVIEEHGQGMTEYGLVLGIIAVAVVTSLVAMRGSIVSLFTEAQTNLGDGVTGLTTP